MADHAAFVDPYDGAPAELLGPHWEATKALRGMRRLQEAWEAEIKRIVESQPSDEDRRQLAVTAQPQTQRSMYLLACDIASLHNAATKGDRYMQHVEGAFAAVADGVAEFQGSFATSIHRVVLDVAYRHVRRILRPFLKRCSIGTLPPAWRLGLDELTGPDVLRLLAVQAWPANMLSGVATGVVADEVVRVEAALQQEFYRAWKNHVPSEPATEESQQPRITGPRISASTHPPQVSIDGKAYALTAEAAELVQALVDANGEWISASKVIAQPSRVIRNMPANVRQLIEKKPGAGCRLKAGVI